MIPKLAFEIYAHTRTHKYIEYMVSYPLQLVMIQYAIMPGNVW